MEGAVVPEDVDGIRRDLAGVEKPDASEPSDRSR